MSKHTYTATAPNGQQFTRTTARTYTHCIVSDSDRHPDGMGQWGWAGRPDLAEKKVAEVKKILASYGKSTDSVTAVPVDNPRP